MHLFFILSVVLLSVDLLQAAPREVKEVGEQLIKIRSIQEDIKSLRDLYDRQVAPDIKKIREMDENSKKIAYRMAQEITLDKYGQMLTEQNPDGTWSKQEGSADSLEYSGNGKFSGGNLGNIEGIMGERGMPIGLDRQAPVSLAGLPANFKLNSKMSPLERTLVSAAPYLSSMIGGGKGAQAITSCLSAALGASAAAPGVFVRPYAGQADDQFAYWNGQNNPQAMMQFMSGAQNYNPLMGNQAGAASMSNSLANVLSAGALAAVNSFSAEKGGGGGSSNPYSAMATTMLPAALSQMSGASVGSTLDLSQASGSFTRLAPLPPVPSLFSSPLSQEPFRENIVLVQASSTGTKQVAAVTLTAPEQKEFDSFIQSSDGAIKQTAINERKADLLRKYVQSQMESTQELMQQAKKIRSEMKEIDAIPELTLLLADLTTHLEKLQGRAEQYEQRSQQWAKDRKPLLQKRRERFEEFDRGLKATKGSRLGAVLNTDA